MSYLIYLHGFNSSPQSEKAQLTRDFFHQNAQFHGLDVYVPDLPPAPLEAISKIKSIVKELGRENLIGFIGSSLGGYYSLYLQYFYSLAENNEGHAKPKVVLINPAVRPFDLLEDFLGENENMYTGERYIVESSHMQDLKSLLINPRLNTKRIYLLTQTSDEVLNYQEAVSFLIGSKMWIQYGGSHAFDGFSSVLPSIKSFVIKP